MSRRVRSSTPNVATEKPAPRHPSSSPYRIIATEIIYLTLPAPIHSNQNPFSRASKKKKRVKKVLSRPNPFLNPLPKLPPRRPNIHEPRPVLEPRVRIPAPDTHLLHLARVEAAFHFPCPDVPLDGLQPGTAEHGADAEEEGGEECFERDVGREVGFRVEGLREDGGGFGG